MADDVPAFNSTRGAKAARNPPAAVQRVPAARGTRHGAAPVPATVVAAAAAFIGASAHQSAMLAYFSALVVSVVPVMRAAWPQLVDGDLGRIDALLRRSGQFARAALGAIRADLAADLRRLRDAERGNAVLAPVYDRAEERARVTCAAVVDGLRRWVEATWSEHKGAAIAACFLLHTVGVVIYTAATALINAAYEAARIRAPVVLSYLRGVIREIRCKEGAVSSCSGFKYRDMAWLVKTVIFLAISADIADHINAILGSSFPIWLPCFMALCSTGAMVSKWAFLSDDSNDSGTTIADTRNTASNASRRAGSRIEPTRAAELKVPESWRFLWSLMVTAYFIDVYLLRVTLGPRPLAVAFVAVCNVKIINVGKKVQRTPEDEGEGAQGSADDGVNNGGANKWRRAAMAVLAASVAKVAVIGVVLNFQLAALSLVSLCITTVLLLIREENLTDLDASGGGNGGEEGAGFTGNITGGADEEADAVRSEHANTSAEDEQEGSALEEQCGSTEEDAREQQHEEPDSSSSSSMDSWDFVEADPRAADQS